MYITQSAPSPGAVGKPRAAIVTPARAKLSQFAATQNVTVPANATKHTTGETVVATLGPQVISSEKPATLTVSVVDPRSGKPLSGASVTADLAMSSMDMGTTHPKFKAIGGKYVAPVSFSMSGDWKVTVHVKSPGEKPVLLVLKTGVGY